MNAATAPRASVVITTYNWPEALGLALGALARQRHLPYEVVVADDGSRDETRALIAATARDYPVPLRHSWQEDRGFRVALARNRAIAASSGDYLLLLDGDMVAHPQFVADHLRAAQPGSFVQGQRVLTDEVGRDRLLSGETRALGFFDRGLTRRRHTLRIPPLAALSLRSTRGQSTAAIKTCNQGWWREDLVALNGFDERYEGWGREDKDLAVRAFHAGLERRSLRFAGLATHLYHRERHDDGDSPNDALLAEAKASGRVRALEGLDRHLAEFAAAPLADLRSR
ncbi:glycosyltransferase family 2 protein [Lysobacter sp. cf310]|uniref:glycosyltransferase family 2 protein n=1 Tax=Lysobacter sp. cf310 TaxID=1761790 RepID=UPI0008EC374B|nr:glycosyltransferase family 2 protein [Lysobacter sp. cf310]SFK54052.1 Glycosyltransferase involved in cell wall bisynthesis [Lysobacter sp. cf310]